MGQADRSRYNDTHGKDTRTRAKGAASINLEQMIPYSVRARAAPATWMTLDLRRSVCARLARALRSPYRFRLRRTPGFGIAATLLARAHRAPAPPIPGREPARLRPPMLAASLCLIAVPGRSPAAAGAAGRTARAVLRRLRLLRGAPHVQRGHRALEPHPHRPVHGRLPLHRRAARPTSARDLPATRFALVLVLLPPLSPSAASPSRSEPCPSGSAAPRPYPKFSYPRKAARQCCASAPSPTGCELSPAARRRRRPLLAVHRASSSGALSFVVVYFFSDRFSVSARVPLAPSPHGVRRSC